MKNHRVSEIFPMMSDDEYVALREDIKANGQLEPIWTYDGQIVDGRNRYKACVELGITPKYREYKGGGDLVAFVVALNLKRRHLTSSQCAAVGVSIEQYFAEEARERQRAAGKDHGRGQEKHEEIFPQPIEREPQARDKAAEMVGTNPRYISDAKKLADEEPDLFDDVKKGEITIPQAKRESQKRELEKKVHDLPDVIDDNERYRILYADPPWHYNDSGIINDDNYGRATRHYPAMTIDQLCAMGKKIKAVTDDNAILFLWVTSPLLPECFDVVKSWGFKYKSSFVWDKVSHNFGHYNSVRHEFLLICTRGSCTPDQLTPMIDSVQSIEKSSTHSEKPDEFRAIIERLYTHGKKLELFARRTTDGWDAWGNETDNGK